MTTARPRTACSVALLADMPSTGHLGETQARRFPMQGGDLAERTADFLEFTREQIDSGYKVIALYPQWRSEQPERAIRFARGAQRTDHVASVGLNLSPLTLSLLADQLAYLAPYLPAGLVAALAYELPRHLVGGAWLRRVSRLANLPTSMGQHLMSYSPKSAFLAVCAPEPRVVQVGDDDAAAGLPIRPVDPVQVLTAAAQGADTSPLESRLGPALRPVSVRALPAQPLGREFFGTAKYLEFVALSAHPEALTRAVNSVRATACEWCREPTGGTLCPFCGAVNRPPAGRPPTHHRANELPPTPQLFEPAGPAAPEPEPSPVPAAAAPPGPAPPAAVTMAPSGIYRSEPLQPASDPVAPAPTENGTR